MLPRIGDVAFASLCSPNTTSIVVGIPHTTQGMVRSFKPYLLRIVATVSYESWLVRKTLT